MPTQTEKRRPSFRWTLIVLAVSLVLGLVFATVQFARRVRQKRRIVSKLEDDHNIVQYGYEVLRPGAPSKSPPGPFWLRSYFGDDIFAHVELVHFQESPVEEEDLRFLGHLTELKTLHLNQTRENVPRVLLNLPKLENLALTERQKTLTGKDLQILTQLPQLKYLALNGQNITDEGMAELAQIPRLQILKILDAEIPSQGLAYLGKAKNLKHLTLFDNSVNNRTLTGLTKLTQLQTLRLHSTQVTDKGLLHLRPLSNLEELTIGPRVTEPAARRLKKALPDCTITGVNKNGTHIFELQ